MRSAGGFKYNYNCTNTNGVSSYRCQQSASQMCYARLAEDIETGDCELIGTHTHDPPPDRTPQATKDNEEPDYLATATFTVAFIIIALRSFYDFRKKKSKRRLAVVAFLRYQ